MKPVRCIQTNQVYPSMRAAAKAHFVCVTSISLAVHHGYRCAGFNWELVHENNTSKRRRRRVYYHKNEPVIRSDGTVYDSVTAAANANGISVNAIWKAISRTNLTGKLSRAGGFGWAYQRKPPKRPRGGKRMRVLRSDVHSQVELQAPQLVAEGDLQPELPPPPGPSQAA